MKSRNNQVVVDLSALPADPQALVSKLQLRAICGSVSARTIERHVKDGILPKPVVFGGLVRWRRGEVDAALAKLPRSSVERNARRGAAANTN